MSCSARKPMRAMTRTLGTDQGPFEVQEAIESIVASLPVMAEHVSSISDGQKATALDALESHYLQTALGLGYSEEPARSTR